MKVGEVLAVSGAHITIEVSREISDLHIRYEGHTYTVGQPGSFLIIDSGHDKHLVLVTTIKKSEISLEKDTNNLFQDEIKHDKTLIAGILVGTIIGNDFEIGLTQFPVVGDNVILALDNHLKIALKPPEDRSLISIGNFADSDIKVSFDFDNLLGKHTAILGSTGCGKSYTVARLLQNIIKEYPSAHIILFDLHGEYKNCFKNSDNIDASTIKLPAWLHTFEDLFSLCADLDNTFNIHNQRWAFREGIFRLKQKYCKEILKDNELSNNFDLDAPIPFSVEYFGNWLHNQNYATKEKFSEKITCRDESGTDQIKEESEFDWFSKKWKFQEKKTNKITGSSFLGVIDRLVLRYNSRLKDPRYSFIFSYDDPQKDDLKNLIEKISGLVSDSPNQIKIFDLSGLPSETIGSVVSVISKILFQIHFLSKRKKYIPTLVVYEEAHNYIPRSGKGAYGQARESVERIAKEGRKFGIGTIVVSQRPSELSETLLSQCNSFLCMRLNNSVDKNYISALLPDSMKELIDILPVLPRGNLIAVGQATKMPIRVKVDSISDDKVPDSGDQPFGEMWKVKITERKIPNIETICDNWIKLKKENE